MPVEKRLIALKLLLDALGIPDSISNVSDRKRLQKAVYLAQRLGADLGYRFSWYLMGPYSTALTKDYYQLANRRMSLISEVGQFELHPKHRESVELAQNLMVKPDWVQLEECDWLELLASLDYLQRVSRYVKKDAIEEVKKRKPHLAEFAPVAENALKRLDLN